MDKLVAGIIYGISTAHRYSNPEIYYNSQNDKLTKLMLEHIEKEKQDDALSIYLNQRSSNRSRFSIHPILKQASFTYCDSPIMTIASSSDHDHKFNVYYVENIGDCSTEEFTKTIKALNYGTPYSFSFNTESIYAIYNLYIKRDYLKYAFPKDIPSDLLIGYLINLKWIAFGVIAKLYSSLYFNNTRNLECIATNLAIAIARSLECAVTPQLVSDAFEVELDVAESLIDSFDVTTKKFDNEKCLSWFIRF